MGGNIGGVVTGVVVLVLSLVMVAIGMTIVADVINDHTITWSDYPGAEDMLGLFPLLMLVGLTVLSGLIINLGSKGGAVQMRVAIMAPLTAIVAVILLPTVMGFIDDIANHTSIALFNGLDSVAGILPMLYVVGMMGLVGIMGVATYKSKS